MTGRTRPWLRAVIIAALTLFFGSALILPGGNPLTRGWTEQQVEHGMLVSQFWAEIGLVRNVVATSLDNGSDWHEAIHDLDRLSTGSWVDWTSTGEGALTGTVRRVGSLPEGLAGGVIELDYDRERRRWHCSGGTPSVQASFLPPDCRVPLIQDPIGLMGWILAGCMAFLLAGAVLLYFKHPLIAPYLAQPQRLRRAALTRLPEIDRALRWMGRRGAALRTAGIPQPQWERARMLAIADADARVQALALAVGAQAQGTSGWNVPGTLFEWRFTNTLPVALERCLVWCPPAGLEATALIQHARRQGFAHEVVLILASPAQEPAIAAFARDGDNPFVCIDGATQTECLLAQEPIRPLLRALARQLKVTRISPWQTRGGISRPDAFFGREQLLARVIRREPQNYLLVGGRQLGKTSLMKAIERRLADHPDIACEYLVLRDHRLPERLAAHAGLPTSSPLDDTLRQLGARAGGRRLLLLIDEADPFIRADADNHFVVTSTLRAASEEGLCHAMLAGFWDLYAAAVQDYHSPLRNFGEVLSIGALEPEACFALATQPLALLGLRWADPSLPRALVEASGGRANLVAIQCQECLEALAPGERVLEADHLARAQRSPAVRDALAGWGRLSHDERGCLLDRLIVHLVAREGTVALEALSQALAALGVRPSLAGLESSLARLCLAFVLVRGTSGWRFAVPLFAAQFSAEELPHLIDQQARDWLDTAA